MYTLGPTSAPDRRAPLSSKGLVTVSLLRGFAWTAILESTSWILLLVSMFFTYVVETSWGDGAISLFGSIHGFLVIIYVLLFVACLIRYRFGLKTIVIDVLALFVPGLGFWVAKLTFDQEKDLRMTEAESTPTTGQAVPKTSQNRTA